VQRGVPYQISIVFFKEGGKTLIANRIHQYSKYKEKIPIKIDCATLNENNLEVLFSEEISNLNENLFIISNNNTLILEKIKTQFQLNFKNDFLYFIEKSLSSLYFQNY
jgi:Transcriptional regulator containing GAF, AAA-type ATPase, and DNA binding domains